MRIKKPTTSPRTLKTIIEVLSDKPELAERIEGIVKLADEPEGEGRVRSADEVEALLVEELRKLGNDTLVDWAGSVDRHLGVELKKEKAGVKMREKKL